MTLLINHYTQGPATYRKKVGTRSYHIRDSIQEKYALTNCSFIWSISTLFFSIIDPTSRYTCAFTFLVIRIRTTSLFAIKLWWFACCYWKKMVLGYVYIKASKQYEIVSSAPPSSIFGTLKKPYCKEFLWNPLKIDIDVC